MKSKVSAGLLLMMSLFSMIGFLSIVLNAFTQIDIGKYTSNILLILLGFGFLMEGQARFILRMVEDGRLTSTEISHIVTSVIGAIALISGIISFFVTQSQTILTIQGIISIIAIIIIIIETLVVK